MARFNWFVHDFALVLSCVMLAIDLSFQVVAIPFCQRLEIGPHISPASRNLFYELKEDKVATHVFSCETVFSCFYTL